jgi:acetylornithine deacetylase/succinyl-diaminopimelate desuccinylase-like protein
VERFDADAVKDRVSRDRALIRDELERLVRIPSVSADGFDPQPVRQSAEASAEILQAAGFSVRLAETEGTHPAVIGEAAGPAGTPTILLYAHHDVQPTGPEELWLSPPFEPTNREGRLYGRGVADDKAGVVAHAAALRAWDGHPPVTVKVFVEGEEEIGSTHLAPFLERHGVFLQADAIILADSSNWRLGQPALTTSLRGLVDCVVEVRTLDHAVHSGMYGGPIPDALTALSRLLASLHDDDGRVAVPGLVAGESDPLDLTEEELRHYAGVRPSVRLTGDGTLTGRLWTKPSVSVLGIDAPSVRDASNKLVPSARAKVSLRLAPGDHPAAAMDALASHLEANAPWGAEVFVHRGASGLPYRIDASGPMYDAVRASFGEAWGRAPVDIGAGGSIPFVAAFAAAYPTAAIMLTGVEDPEGNAHSENESVVLEELERACLAEALFLGHAAEAV